MRGRFQEVQPVFEGNPGIPTRGNGAGGVPQHCRSRDVQHLCHWLQDESRERQKSPFDARMPLLDNKLCKEKSVLLKL